MLKIGIKLGVACVVAKSAQHDSLPRQPTSLHSPIAIIAAGLVTAYILQTAWPDLLLGLAIAALNADTAFKVWEEAQKEAQMQKLDVLYSSRR